MARAYTGRKFSIPFFVIINILSLATLLGATAFFAPNVWRAQLEASWWSFTLTFLTAHIGIAFVEFFFHRYVLHAPLIRWLAYFYKQHTVHHALTRVRMKYVLHEGPHGTVENIYPILEDTQHEASFFPWYTFGVLSCVLFPFFVLAQILLPTAPIFLAGLSALMWSILLYEIFHALEHKPLKKWLPFFEHPTRGEFWKQVYGFHLRHHANVLSNESVSGFFGLPIPDWVFGTYVKAETLYPHGSIAIPTTFAPPKPRCLSWLDRRAEQAKKRRKSIVDV